MRIECVSKCRVTFLVKTYLFIRVYFLSFIYEDGMITSQNIFKTFEIFRIVTWLHDKGVAHSILQPKFFKTLANHVSKACRNAHRKCFKV